MRTPRHLRMARRFSHLNRSSSGRHLGRRSGRRGSAAAAAGRVLAGGATPTPAPMPTLLLGRGNGPHARAE